MLFKDVIFSNDKSLG